EQRFGVTHKERLKALKTKVDVLTLSATPIPRTLNMAFLGLRDMSTIETPPKNRLAIQTSVLRYSPDVIRSAIELELARKGQVYFVHNRVETIQSAAALVQQLIPEARVGIAHGQMSERELERVSAWPPFGNSATWAPASASRLWTWKYAARGISWGRSSTVTSTRWVLSSTAVCSSRRFRSSKGRDRRKKFRRASISISTSGSRRATSRIPASA